MYSTAAGHVDAPSWGPGGQIVYHSDADRGSRLEWMASLLRAVRMRSRSVPPGPRQPISTTFPMARSAGARCSAEMRRPSSSRRPWWSRRRSTRTDAISIPLRRASALGIVRPVISPDGTKVAFAAVGDIYVMPVGGKPENITKDKYLDTDPAWSPDGSQLVYSSDKGGGLLQLWIRDIKTGRDRQLTHMTTQPQGAAWSPDGKNIAFFDVDAMWRESNVSVVDVASGQVTKIHDSLFAPGTPTWSADGKTDRTRDGGALFEAFPRRHQSGADDVRRRAATYKWYAPVPILSIDSRGECGPVWSPDGTKMAAIYEGVLAVWPVSPSGEPLGPPRHVTTESAHAPSWFGDSKHILYQALGNKLKSVDIETGEVKTIPLDLKYTPDVPEGAYRHSRRRTWWMATARRARQQWIS